MAVASLATTFDRDIAAGALCAVMGIGTLRGLMAATSVAALAVMGCGAPPPIRSPQPPEITTPPPSPAPERTRTRILVPASIDATGASDASAAIDTWLLTLPDNSTIVFKAGSTYRLDRALKFSSRHNLTFEGNGATLKAGGTGTTEVNSLFALWSDDTGITIRDFNLVGNSPTPGVYQAGQEGAHGVFVVGGANIEIANVTISAVWGDGIKITGAPNTVWFHDSHVVSAGRNGVTIGAGANITIERDAFDRSGYCTFDIEPNTSGQTTSNVKFLNNTAGTWTNSFLSADGAVGSVVSGVTVSGNTVTGGSLHTEIDLARRQDVVFTNNTSLVPAAGPVLRFAHVDGLTVTGNIQPLRSGALASITDCTGVTYLP